MSELKYTPEQMAQWVINNRYPKSEMDKVSDAEMYHSIIYQSYKIIESSNTELLEALEDLIYTTEDLFHVEAAKAAIAKAKGEKHVK